MNSRNIFGALRLKPETFMHAQLVITLLYILLSNILAWYQMETYIKDTPW